MQAAFIRDRVRTLDQPQGREVVRSGTGRGDDEAALDTAIETIEQPLRHARGGLARSEDVNPLVRPEGMGVILNPERVPLQRDGPAHQPDRMNRCQRRVQDGSAEGAAVIDMHGVAVPSRTRMATPGPEDQNPCRC